MKPISFPEVNANIGEGQRQYFTIPAVRLNDSQGTVVFCWQLSWRERIKLLLTGKLWHAVMTFNRPFQPQMLSTTKERASALSHTVMT